MKRRDSNNTYTAISRSGNGFVLIIVLVMLVVLATLGYTITVRVSSEKHRDNYVVNYSKARYARDSAAKYAVAAIEDINSPQIIERANEPDFSDLFALSEKQYRDFLEQWAKEMSRKEFQDKVKKSGSRYNPDTSDINDINSPNNIAADTPANTNSVPEPNEVTDYNDPNRLEVPGPYGPQWPLITEPVEFEIGEAEVEITIEDENAKYPIGWAILEDNSEGEDIEREAEAGFETFCEWMDVNEVETADLKEQLENIEQIKKFSMNFKEIKIKDTTASRNETTRSSQPKGLTASEERPREERSARAALKRYMERRKREEQKKKMKKKGTVEEGKVTEDIHIADFCRIFNSPLLDSKVFTRPRVESETRDESAMKYLGMWGTRRVNINTAPRHVLEAAFNFGGDYVQIADSIIIERRTEPFKSIDDLKERLFRYSDSIENCEEFITTESDMFTIRVKATSGTATARAIIAVRRNNGEFEKIAAFSE